MARIRKSLFDILSPRLAGARVLDLYAGSGSFGLEALSRGAAETVLVESSPPALEVLAANISELGAGTETRLLRKRAIPALEALALGEDEFDLVFADPPFKDEALSEILSGVARVLVTGGMVVVRVPRVRSLPSCGGGLSLVRTESYGVSKVGFYRSAEE